MKTYKYRSFNEYLIPSLEKNECWASLAKDLNDPFEAMIDQGNINTFLDVISIFSDSRDLRFQLNKVMEKRLSVGIFSLSRDWGNELLWAHYAESHKGICIEYDIDKVTTFYPGNFHKTIDVEYLDGVPDINSEILLKDKLSRLLNVMLGTKSKVWEYENEIRIIFDVPGAKSHPINAIRSITLGARIEENNKKEILRIAQAKKYPVYACRIYSKKYEILRELIFDPENLDPEFEVQASDNQYYTLDKNTKIENPEKYLWLATKKLMREEWVNVIYDVMIPSDISESNYVKANVQAKAGYPIDIFQVCYTKSELEMIGDVKNDELMIRIKSMIYPIEEHV